MAQMPRIANIQCSRLKFEPGDRILVRSYHKMDPDTRQKLTKAIQKWAGCEVEVLVICTSDMEMEIDKRAIKL